MMLLLATTLSLMLTACGGDDDDEPTNNQEVLIIGEWRHDFSDGYQILSFGKYGTYTMTEIDFVSGNWSVFGKWNVKDGTLTCEYSEDGGGKEKYTIIALTKTKMVLRLDEYWEDIYHGFGDEDDIEEWTRVE